MSRDTLLGTIVAGRFRIHEILGEGACGVVYLAEHARRGTRHAVKVLHASLEDDDWVVERFRREALAASRLDHPNIVFIEDFGRAEDGQFYLVMPYVPGTSLEDVIADAKPAVLPYPRVLRILAQVGDGLAAAHDQAIIHRDVKPANILLHVDASGAERVMMLDFGLAKMMVDPDLSVLTQKGEVFGTPAYMSPEQAAGEEVDTRTDVYSFGVLAYETLAGRLPFEANTLPKLLIAHLHSTPPPIAQMRPSNLRPLPPELAAAIMRCLAKDPDERADRVSEVVRVLTRCLDALGEPDGLRESIDLAPPDDTLIQGRWQTTDAVAVPGAGDGRTVSPTDDTAFGGSDDGRSFRWSLLCQQAREVAQAMRTAREGDDRLGVHLERISALETEIIATDMTTTAKERDHARVDQTHRDREAQLRFAVVTLSLDRDRLANAATDPAALTDLDFQIAQLESQLADACVQRQVHQDACVEWLKDRREHVRKLRVELTTEDLMLLQSLGKSAPGASAPADVRAAYAELAGMMS